MKSMVAFFGMCLSVSSLWAAVGPITADTTWTATQISTAATDGGEIAVSEGATLTLELAVGDVLTLPNVISGKGAVKVTGTRGKLTLSGANTFSGGLTTDGTTYTDSSTKANIANVVTATANTSFGTGKVTVKDGSRIVLMMADAANDFDIGHNYGILTCNSSGLDVTGKITMKSPATRIAFDVGSAVNLRGEIDAGASGRVVCTGDGRSTIDVYGKITAATVGPVSDTFMLPSADLTTPKNQQHQGRSSWYFHTPDAPHAVTRYVSGGFSTLVTMDNEVFGTSAILENCYNNNSYYGGDGKFAYDLNGTTQTVDRIHCTVGLWRPTEPNTERYYSAKPALLKMQATADAPGVFAQFDDKVSLDWMPTGAHTLTLTGRTHRTSGELTVSSGKVKLDANTTFANVTRVNVKNGAKFEIGAGVNPFTAGAVTLNFTGTGKLVLPANATLSVDAVIVDGERQPMGVYESAAWLEGSGAKVVAAHAVWTKADYDAYRAEHSTLAIPEGCKLTFDYTPAMTSTVDCVFTGAGSVVVAGTGGKIVFTGASSYSGGFSLSGATRVEAANATALGTGTVAIDVVTGKDQTKGLWFTGENTFANPISANQSCYLNFLPSSGKTITMTGKITALADVMLRCTETVNIRGDIDATGHKVTKAGDKFSGNVNLYGHVDADSVRQDCSDWGRGYLCFCGTSSVGLVSPSIGKISTSVVNPWSADTVMTFYDGIGSYYQRGADEAMFVLGADVTANRILSGPTFAWGQVDPATGLWGDYKSGNTEETTGVSVNSSKAMTLTLKGSASSWTHAKIRGDVSLTWDPVGDYVFALSNRTHTTTGKLTVKGGTLLAGRGTSFPNVTALEVAAGAKFIFDTNAANGFTDKLTTLVIGSSATSEVVLPAGLTLSVTHMLVDGRLAANGDITPATATWLKGDNVKITVAQGGDNCWIPATGNWSAAANWTVGVPTWPRDGNVLSFGADVAATVSSDVGQVGAITVGRASSASAGSATVKVENGGAITVQSNAFTIADGGRLEIGGTSTFLFSPDVWHGNALVVKKGGVLDVLGNALVGPADGTAAPRVFGDGQMTFRGHSTFGRTVSKGAGGWNYRFAVGSGSPTGRVEFLEQAVFKDMSSSLIIDRGVGYAAQLLLGSDASHTFKYKTYLGCGDGHGELVITNGFAQQEGHGFCIPGNYEKRNQKIRLTSSGRLEVSGEGRLSVASQDTQKTGILCGLLVGDDSIASVDATTRLGKENAYTGLVEVAESGSLVVGTGSACILGIGNPNVKGSLHQTGGAFTNLSNLAAAQMALGVGGATGEWIVEGGTANVNCNVYVGGATLEQLGRTAWPATDGNREYYGMNYPNQAKGLLKVTGGQVTLKQNLVFSSDGVGKLELGPTGRLDVVGQLDARANSELVVDARGYAGKGRTLATFGGTATAFADAKVTFLKDENAPYTLKISSTRIRLSDNSGFAVIVR